MVINNLCDIIKILGVYFGGDGKKREELNFWKTLESIKKTINLWKWRGLSLIGRIQIKDRGGGGAGRATALPLLLLGFIF